MGTCYLLHFDQPISDRHTCQHYLGWSNYLPARALAHLTGRGARLTQIARERNIGFQIVRVWPNSDRHFERALKRQKHGPRLCPLCRKAHPGLLALDLDEDLL